MDFIPYKANKCFEHLYYQVPMELFFNPKYKDKLSSDSKILYAFLLNRFKLSDKNHWRDNNGNIYLIFTRKEVQEMLNLSDKTVTKAFKQLKDCKLIYEKKQGYMKPNLIYIGKIQHEEMTRKNYDSRDVKSTSHNTEFLRARNKYNRINERNYKECSSNIDWDALYDN